MGSMVILAGNISSYTITRETVNDDDNNHKIKNNAWNYYIHCRDQNTYPQCIWKNQNSSYGVILAGNIIVLLFLA